MNVTCNQCHKKYSIADDKVRGKTVKIRCKQCQNVITVSGMASGEPEPAQSAEWFAMLKGKQEGPLSADNIRARIGAGQLTPRTHMWKSGMGDWKRAQEIEEIKALFDEPQAEMPKDIATAPQTSAQQPLNPQSGDGAVSQQKPAPGLANLFDSGLSSTESSSESQAGPELTATSSGSVRSVGEEAKDKSGHHSDTTDDPFASVGGGAPVGQEQIGEATRFFIRQSGADRRNPWWKIALAIVLIPGVLIAGSYGFIMAMGKPLVIINQETGEERAVEFFSGEGILAVKDILTGKNDEIRKEMKERAPQKRVNKPKNPGVPGTAVAVAKVEEVKTGNTGSSGSVESIDINSLGGGSGPVMAEKGDVGVQLRGTKETATDTAGGIDQQRAEKVLANNLPSFRNCIEQALRKNPNLRAGKVTLIVSIEPSGVVKTSSLKEKKFENDEWVGCLKDRAKRMVFPKFAGDPVDLEVPMVVGASLD